MLTKVELEMMLTRVELEVNADEGRTGGKATRRQCD